MKAASSGDLKMVTDLLAGGATINARDIFGQTALMYAVSARHTPIILALLNSDVDLNVKNQNGLTALGLALSKGSRETAQMLINASLLFAARDGDLPAIRKILEGGAEIDATISEGWTALMIATINGHTAVVEGLLAGGASVNLRTDNGWTALMIAVRKGYSEIGQMLRKAGAREFYSEQPRTEKAAE
jgi:ankyrin repeat protein